MTGSQLRQSAGGLGLALLGMLLAWATGFAWFVHLASRPPLPPPARVDGIVALTGSADRVETALRLLAAGRADHLLLSGIGGGAELTELAHRAGLDPLPLAARVTLGRGAISTHGNALETEAWARANRIRSLIVVTAWYHMPRALAELARAVPDVTLYPEPVLIASPQEPGGAGRIATLRLLAEEYTKFLAAELGLTRLVPRHDYLVTAPSGRSSRSG
jgi:uncharacterized SAM-binding protein YcdF (DUF218 family)